MSDEVPKNCILCLTDGPQPFSEVRGRCYYHCSNCDLVFLSPDQRPTATEEVAEYSLHNNDPEDLGYRKHLSKLTGPLVEGLAQNALGLDFGCGPGPTISKMLGEQGYKVADYDPYFADDSSVLDQTYDFISCTEAAEHFYNPAKTFDDLAKLLKPGGRLGLMTQFRPPNSSFADWYYIKERSHVTFYNERSFSWLAGEQGWSIRVLKHPIVIFENET